MYKGLNPENIASAMKGNLQYKHYILICKEILKLSSLTLKG